MAGDERNRSLGHRADSLREIVRSLGSCLVAFSGGVDSTLLAKVCQEELGADAVAVTAVSEIHPEFEVREAKELATLIGIRHEVVEVEPLQIDGFADNPPERCYLCKRAVFGHLQDLAKQWGLSFVVDGTNADDSGDFRPGQRAIDELGVRSPIKEAGLTKADVRRLSKDLGLPTWSKPSYACLASRFPYGRRITPDELRMVDRSEEALRSMGFAQSRVRHHDDLARIEVAPEEIPRLAEPECREGIVSKLKEIGYRYVALDLEGYRTGSMNEALTEAEKQG